MSLENDEGTPQSPEVEPAEIREDLDQDQITHVGAPRKVSGNEGNSSDHMGAVDGETTPVRALMTGPDDITEGESEDYDDVIDPRDEMTPG